MISVGHVRRDVGERVCRPSPLGNPFSHKPSQFAVTRVPSREEAVARYREWLDGKLGDLRSPQSLELSRLLRIFAARGELTLLCWCHPLQCHAGVVREVMLARLGIPAA